MRVLLLYPEFPDTFWSFKHALGFVSKRASMPPVGLLTIAAMLPADWELRLIDTNVTAPAGIGFGLGRHGDGERDDRSA